MRLNLRLAMLLLFYSFLCILILIVPYNTFYYTAKFFSILIFPVLYYLCRYVYQKSMYSKLFLKYLYIFSE